VSNNWSGAGERTVISHLDVVRVAQAEDGVALDGVARRGDAVHLAGQEREEALDGAVVAGAEGRAALRQRRRRLGQVAGGGRADQGGGD